MLAQALALLPLGALLAWWGLDQGGYAPELWEPGAVVLLAVAALVAGTTTLRARRRPTRRLLVALGAFGLYTAWSYASVAWAGDRGAALEGAHRCTLYLAAMAGVGLTAPGARVLRGAAVAAAAIVGLAAVVTGVRLARADGAEGFFLDGRLLAPVGYINANAAFWTMGALLGAVAASQRQTHPVLRPPLLALAAVELGLAVMAASRGWLFTLPVVVLVVLVLVPGRGRFVLAALAAGVPVLPALGALLGPLDAGGGRSVADGSAATIAAAHHALGPLLLVGGAALLLGGLGTLADRRVVLSEAAHRRARRAGAAVAAVLAFGAIGAGVAVHPSARLQHAWADFKANDARTTSGAGRLGAAGSSRYDFWRVATDLVAEHPVRGIGQDNFAEPYLARRASTEEPRWVHSLPLRALVHTGIVGALALALALGALVAGALRLRGRPEDRATAALALVPLVVWTIHGSVDWFWEFPVLSVLALGLAAGAGSAQAPPALARGRPALRRAGMAGAVLLAVAGILAVGSSYVATRDLEEASAHWPADPRAAFKLLDQAASLTPSAQPFLVEGVIAQRMSDTERARQAFGDAMRRAPGDWFAPLQLGLLAAAHGDERSARALLAGAARRNPKDTVIRAARRAVDRGKPFTAVDVETALAERERRRFGG